MKRDLIWFLVGFVLGYLFRHVGVLQLARAWVGVIIGKWRAKLAAKIGGKA